MKLNKPTYMLICLIEECAEVIQRACKAIRFGMDEKEPGQDKTNQVRLDEEWQDLQGVVQMNQHVGNIPEGFGTGPAIGEKKRKVAKYIKYSEDIGTLERD